MSLLVEEIRHRVDKALVTLSLMIVPALHSLRTLALLAFVHLIVEWMVDLLFPSVTSGAVSLQRTSLVVLTDEATCLPILTEFSGIVIKQVGLATEVMPVVSIDTLSFVVGLDVWAPFCLKVVHEEVQITWHLMYQSCLDVIGRVSE